MIMSKCTMLTQGHYNAILHYQGHVGHVTFCPKEGKNKSLVFTSWARLVNFTPTHLSFYRDELPLSTTSPQAATNVGESQRWKIILTVHRFQSKLTNKKLSIFNSSVSVSRHGYFMERKKYSKNEPKLFLSILVVGSWALLTPCMQKLVFCNIILAIIHK